MEITVDMINVRNVISVALLILLFSVIVYHIKEKKMPNFILIVLIVLSMGASTGFEYKYVQEVENINTGFLEISNDQGNLVCERAFSAFFNASESQHSMENPNSSGDRVLNYTLCNELRSWLESDKTDTTGIQVRALGAVAYEAVVASGFTPSSGQGQATSVICQAVNVIPDLVMAYGGTQEEGMKVSSYYVSKILPTLADKYQPSSRSSSC